MRHALVLLFVALMAVSSVVAAGVKPEAVVRAALANLASGDPVDDLMTPEAARQMQVELDQYLRDTLLKLGPLKSLYGMGSAVPATPLIYSGKHQKLAQYQATYEHGWIQWRVFVRPDGKIGRLVPFSINAPGTD